METPYADLILISFFEGAGACKSAFNDYEHITVPDLIRQAMMTFYQTDLFIKHRSGIRKYLVWLSLQS